MKDLQIKVEKINGLADDKNACGVFSKRIEAGDDAGVLSACILVKDINAADSGATLHGIFEAFAEKLDGVTSEVGQAVQEGLDSAGSIVTSRKLEAGFAACYFFGGACYIAKFGNKVKVWSYKGEKSRELKIDFGSGPYSRGQVFAIGTDKFFSDFDTKTLENAEEINLEDIIDGLATDIAIDNSQSEIGVIFAKVGESDETKDEASEGPASQTKRGELKTNEDNLEKPDEETQPHEAEEAEQEEARVAVDESLDEYRESREKHERAPGFAPIALLAKIPSLFLAEVGKLRGGDIGALFRLRRNIVILAVVLLAILGTSALVKVNSARQATKLAEFNQIMESATTHFSEAEAIMELNRERAREKLIEADKEVTKALELKADDEQAKTLKNDIASKLKDTENVASIPFEETEDVDEGIVSISQSAREIWAISASKVYKISKDGEVLDEFDGPGSAGEGFIFGDGAFEITGDKVVRVDLRTEEVSDVGNISGWKDIAVFVSNVYVLTGDQILKFIPIEGGYSEPTDYLVGQETFDSNSRFAIDGSIWVTRGNQILKYTRGAKEDFSISGLVGTEVGFGEIYTDSASDDLYVVDKLNGALLVISKEGLYKKAYQSPEFKTVVSLVVDEIAGKVYIASGSKVFEASL